MLTMWVTGTVRATLFFSANVMEHKVRSVQSAMMSIASQHQAERGIVGLQYGNQPYSAKSWAILDSCGGN